MLRRSSRRAGGFARFMVVVLTAAGFLLVLGLLTAHALSPSATVSRLEQATDANNSSAQPTARTVMEVLTPDPDRARETQSLIEDLNKWVAGLGTPVPDGKTESPDAVRDNPSVAANASPTVRTVMEVLTPDPDRARETQSLIEDLNKWVAGLSTPVPEVVR